MRRTRVKLAIAVAVLGVVVTTTAAVAGGGGKTKTKLTGFEEVPALSTPGVGSFKAKISRSSQEIRYELRYESLESAVTQAHIHFEQRSNNGPIVAFLCSNLPNPPAGTQACPPAPATVTGTITPADVGAGAAAQGLAAGEFDEFVRAIRAGATYANVHTTGRPGGEIRGQIGDKDGHRKHNGHNGHDDD
jgi:hypothetical protein